MDLHIGILRRSNVTISLSIGRQRKNAIDLHSGKRENAVRRDDCTAASDSFGLDSLEPKAQGYTRFLPLTRYFLRRSYRTLRKITKRKILARSAVKIKTLWIE